MTETTLTPAPDDVIEYGATSRAQSTIVWPDSDGDLLVGGGYVYARDLTPRALDALRDKVAGVGGQLFERTLSASAARPVAAPLPAVGSLARADVVSDLYGDLGRQSLIRLESETHPWTLVSEHRGAGISAAGVTNVEVVFDAGA